MDGVKTTYTDTFTGASDTFTKSITALQSVTAHVYWTAADTRDNSSAHSFPADKTVDCGGKIQVHKYLWTGTKWENQGVGQGTWNFDVHTGSAAGTIVASGNQLQPITGVPASEVWVTEQPKTGSTLAGFTIPNPGNSKCEQGDTFNGPFTSSADVLASYFTNPADHDNQGVVHVCAYNIGQGTGAEREPCAIGLDPLAGGVLQELVDGDGTGQVPRRHTYCHAALDKFGRRQRLDGIMFGRLCHAGIALVVIVPVRL